MNFLVWTVECMHSLLINDDAEGLKRDTGVLDSQWILYVLKQLEHNTLAYKGANLPGRILKYTMSVELEHHVLHYPCRCLTFMLRSLTCVIVFARATFVLRFPCCFFATPKASV